LLLLIVLTWTVLTRFRERHFVNDDRLRFLQSAPATTPSHSAARRAG